MRRRGGMSGARAKRSFWPHPGQVTVNDEAWAEGWLITKRRQDEKDLCPILSVFRLPVPGGFCQDGARADRRHPRPKETKELDDAEETACSLDLVDALAALLLRPRGSPAR